MNLILDLSLALLPLLPIAPPGSPLYWVLPLCVILFNVLRGRWSR